MDDILVPMLCVGMQSPFDKVDKKVDRTIAVIDKTVQKIEDKNFFLAVEDRPGKLCGDCDINHYCNAVM